MKTVKHTKWVLFDTTSDPDMPEFLTKTIDGNNLPVFDTGFICDHRLLTLPTREIARDYAKGFFDLTPKKMTIEVRG
jgi:hypothetical protein